MAPPPGSETATSGGLPPIIVTARRRAENIENVPEAIQVLTAASLADRGIHDEASLQTAVPGQNRPADQYLVGWTRDFVVASAA